MNQNTRNKVAKEQSKETIHTYLSYGLCIQSELLLPELASDSSKGESDVSIRIEKFDLSPLNIKGAERSIVTTSEGTYFYWKSFGAFLVRGGDTILVHPELNISFQFIRIPLLGVVLGTLLHQRGLFTLHASVVAIEGHAVAFLGAKRAGKSTMAAALNARGHAMVADDVLALDFHHNGQPMALPGFPQFKLSPGAITELNGDPEEVFELHPQIIKKAFRPSSAFQELPLPLKKIYILNEGSSISSKPLSARAAFMEMVTHSYAARFLGKEGGGREHFERCNRLVQEVPIYSLVRPCDLAQISSVVDFVEVNYNLPP